MSTLLNIQYTPKQDLQYAAESLSSVIGDSLEAARNMGGRVKALMPSIISGFAGTKEVTSLVDLKDLSREEPAFLKNITKVSFAEVRTLRADVPEGFDGYYLDYVGVLSDCAKELEQLTTDVLKPYAIFLGQLVSARDVKRLVDDRAHQYKKSERERKDGYKAIARYFTTVKADNSKLIGDVIQRNGDWTGVFTQLNKATASINAVDRDVLKDLVSQAEDYLEVLHGMLKDDKLQGITPESSKALAAGAYEVAQHIEYYSVVYYRILGFTNALAGTVERVNKVFG